MGDAADAVTASTGAAGLWHVGHVNDTAMRRGRRAGEGLHVRFPTGHIFAGIDVHVPHVGEDKTAFREGIGGRAEISIYGGDGPSLHTDLSRTNPRRYRPAFPRR